MNAVHASTKQKAPKGSVAEVPKPTSNPFPYLADGVKYLARSNVKTFFATVAFSLLSLVLFLAVAMNILFTNQTLGGAIDYVSDNRWTLAVLGLVIAFIDFIGTLVFYRLLYLGAKNEPTTFSDLLKFVARRWLAILAVYLFLGLLILVPLGLVAWLGITVSPWIWLAAIPVLAIAALVEFFLRPISLLVVDDQPIGGLASLFRRLFKLWRYGFLPLLVYLLMMSFISGMMSVGVPDVLPSRSANVSVGNNGSGSSDTDTADKGKGPHSFNEFYQEAREVKLEKVKWFAIPVGLFATFYSFIAVTFQGFFAAGLARLYHVLKSYIAALGK